MFVNNRFIAGVRVHRVITLLASLSLLFGSAMVHAAAPPEVWAGDAGNTRRALGGIVRYNFAGTQLGSINQRCDGLAVVGGEVWAADAGNQRKVFGAIYRYGFNGSLIGSVNQRADSLMPVGSEVWAGDCGNQRRVLYNVFRYQFNTTPIGSFNARADTLCVVGSEVWAGDSGNTRRVLGGTTRYQFNSTQIGSFSQRADSIAVVGPNEVWVGDCGNQRRVLGGLARYQFNGSLIGSFGQRADSLASVGGSEVWAGDAGNERKVLYSIVRYRFPYDGSTLGSINQRADALTVVQILDCNTNNINDGTDIASGTSLDCNLDSIPDECDLASGTSLDCNTNNRPDSCDIAGGTSPDCNGGGAPDECDLFVGTALDCNTNGKPDSCDIASGTSADCNTNGIPDECDIRSATSLDCNSNGISDECESGSGNIAWTGANGGSFATGGNWAGGVVPATAGNAILANATGTTNRCIFDSGGTTTVCSISLSASGAGRQLLQINTGGTLRTNNFTSISNGGDLELAGGAIGGGTITNSANTILGYGDVTASVVNQGSIQVTIGKRMTFTGASFSNQASGNLSVPFASFVEIFSPSVTQAGGIEVRALAGLSLPTALTNAAGGSISLFDGAFHATSLTNAAGASISGFGTIDCPMTNNGNIIVMADTQIVGNVTNDGTITLQSGLLTVIGSVSGSGTIIGGFGGRGAEETGIVLSGDFDLATADFRQMQLGSATIQMSGPPRAEPQHLETLAADVGVRVSLPDAALWSIGKLRLGPAPVWVQLVDRHDNTPGLRPEVLYVRELVLDPGTTLDLAGRRLYYAASTLGDPQAPGSGVTIVDTVGGGKLVKIGRRADRLGSVEASDRLSGDQ